VYLHDNFTIKTTMKENVNVQIEVSERARKSFFQCGVILCQPMVKPCLFRQLPHSGPTGHLRMTGK